VKLRIPENDTGPTGLLESGECRPWEEWIRAERRDRPRVAASSAVPRALAENFGVGESWLSLHVNRFCYSKSSPVYRGLGPEPGVFVRPALSAGGKDLVADARPFAVALAAADEGCPIVADTADVTTAGPAIADVAGAGAMGEFDAGDNGCTACGASTVSIACADVELRAWPCFDERCPDRPKPIPAKIPSATATISKRRRLNMRGLAGNPALSSASMPTPLAS